MLSERTLARAADPRSAASLIQLHALIDDVDDLNLLADTYSKLMWRGSVDPHVRTLARLFSADIERARGKTVKAAGLISELGFVQDWYAVGSFDNEGKGGCNTDYGPESAPDLQSTYPTKFREVGWRSPGAKSVDGYVDLSVSLRPNTEAVAYALTFLQAEADTRAILSLGTPGAYRLFINGAKVSSSDRYNLPRIDQYKLQVNLRKGLNRVLLKVCQSNGPLGFYFRAERAPGARGFQVALPESVPPLERGVMPQPSVLPTLTDVLAKRVRENPADAELRAAYAAVLHWSRSYPETEHLPDAEAEKAALARPTDIELQLLAANLHVDDGNDRRRFLEAALKLDPRHPWARLQLARHELARDFPERSLRLTQDLLREFPNFAPACVIQTNTLEALGERVAAVQTIEEAFRRLHVIPNVAREAIAASKRLDRLTEAVERSRMAISLRFNDTNTRRGLASMLADFGRIEASAAQYEKILEMDPFDSSSTLRLADLLAANDRLDEARVVFARARAIAPDDPEVHEREGRALLHAQQKEAALVAFQKSLQLRPQNPTLKETLRTLRGESLTNAAPEAVPASELLALAKTAKGEDLVTIADVTHVRVQTSGLSSQFRQLAAKILSPRGVEAFRQFPITWSPDRQEVRVLRARITKPDGSIVDSHSEQDQNINEPWTGMYYDARARVLGFPELGPGDLLELQWYVEDSATENLLSDYWGDVNLIQDDQPKKVFRYVVDMPQARPLYWNIATLPSWVSIRQSAVNDRLIYRFEARDVPRIVPEPQMPGWSEIASPLHLSTYQNWEQVGRYYSGLVRDQLVPNEELKRSVETILKGVDRSNTAKVVAAIYDFVVMNTRYVALEFGIHGFKPYRVDRVLARRFGDCKDKASLIHAMLNVARVPSNLVLLRMRRLGALHPEVASLAAFNHAIVYVPKLDLFLDGTADFHGSRELPSADRLANVLIVDPEGASRFLTTPEAQPSDNKTHLTMDIALKIDGSAQAKGILVASGQAAPEVRRTYETPASRKSIFEQQWASSFPGINAASVDLSNPKLLEQPATLTFQATLPRFAEAMPGMLRFFILGANRAFTQALAPLAERHHDLLLPGVWDNRVTVNYTLPTGWALAELAAEHTEESAFGTLRITSKKSEGKLVVEATVDLKQARITAEEYPRFREWLLRLDQAFSRKVVVQKGGETTAR
jgi:tetratricopeptide (TPR) repeat protein